MSIGAFFGFMCPRCRSSAKFAVSPSADELLCHQCGGVMVPDDNAGPMAMGAYCARCDASYGIIDSDRCPKCGEPFVSTG